MSDTLQTRSSNRCSTTCADRAAEIWALLYGTWGSPRRASRMTTRRDSDRKYSDLASNYSFNVGHLNAHLAGDATYAATLGAANTAWAGCKDYDEASEAEILTALDQARHKGITAAAIVMPGNRAHLWTFYDRPYAGSDIRAQLRTIRRSGKGEDYPSGNPIRLPFGYHQIKKTRGTLILQDGRRINLDTQLDAGIDALLSLPRNGKPEPAPVGDVRISGAAWGDAYKPEQWDDLQDGGPLWHSPYIAACAKSRPDLATLLRGERVTIVKKDDTRDDSDSAQVAALAYNLLSADVCKPQARAIADYLSTQIRPGRTRDHYHAHFDVELERYTPKYYRPKEIRFLGPVTSAAPQALPPAEHKPEPKSRARKDRPQKVSGPAGYLDWLRPYVDPQSGSVMLSQSQCAARLGCCVRTIKRYEKALGTQIERRVFAQRQAGCLFILAPDVVTTSATDVVTADRGIAHQSAENAPPIVQVEHTAPLVPLPAGGAPPSRWVQLGELRAWTIEAFDAYPGRASIRKVIKHVEMLAEGRRFNLKTLKNCYEQERDRRKWQRQVTKLPTMQYTPLAKLGRRIERILEGGPGGPEAAFFKWADWYQPHVVVELDRRQEMKDRLRPGKRRGATVEEIFILAEIDDQRRRQPAHQQASRGACVPPPTAPALLQPDLFANAPAQSPYYVAALGIADRLRARQEALYGML